MNIFYTNEDPIVCADDHCSRHTNKMIVEYVQMLSTAHRILNSDEYADQNGLYKSTHMNHPSARWVRECYQNYEWLYQVFKQLCENYHKATGKHHKTSRLLDALQYAPMGIKPRGAMTVPPMAMPDQYKKENAVEAYREYVKSKYEDWKNRQRPLKIEWYQGEPLKWVGVL